MLSAEKRAGKGKLVNSSFSNWVKLSDALSSHGKLTYHRDCVAAADVLHEAIVRPASRIDVMTSTQLQERRSNNVHVMK